MNAKIGLSPVSSTRKILALIPKTTRPMVSYICMYVVSVTPKASHSPTPAQPVGIVQKTNNTGVGEQKIDHVKTKFFYNTISRCRASNNWRRDYVTNVKTYADIVKGESSGVYSKTMLHKVTNVEKQYKSPINTKLAKHKGCVKKMYQGVNVALDHEAKTNHIGKFPHILPNQNNLFPNLTILPLRPGFDPCHGRKWESW